ncbi:MAG TPA: zinc ribbon domain-containing protein [Roseiflexaceae bacterium]|nr:zinc ribbon domain-containing protein [Roseiflexaceae bacterium]
MSSLEQQAAVGWKGEEVSAEEFLAQARSYSEESDRSVTDKFYRVVNSLMFRGTHPYAVERAQHLNRYIDSADYEQIVVHRTYPRRAGLVRDGRCPFCGRPVADGYQFCGGCGQKITIR